MFALLSCCKGRGSGHATRSMTKLLEPLNATTHSRRHIPFSISLTHARSFTYLTQPSSPGHPTKIALTLPPSHSITSSPLIFHPTHHLAFPFVFQLPKAFDLGPPFLFVDLVPAYTHFTLIQERTLIRGYSYLYLNCKTKRQISSQAHHSHTCTLTIAHTNTNSI